MKRFQVLMATLLVSAALAVPATALAEIHEKIGAGCRTGGEKVVPPGQVAEGSSFLRALQATGIIESIVDDAGDGNDVKITFDLDKPSSKFMSAGFDLTLPNEIAPGVDLILSPLPVPDPDFPAHANCRNLNP